MLVPDVGWAIGKNEYLSCLFFSLQFQFFVFLSLFRVFIFAIICLFISSTAAAAIASICTARQVISAAWCWWYGVGFDVWRRRNIRYTFRFDRCHFGGQTKFRIRWCCHCAQQWHSFVWTRLLRVRGKSAWQFTMAPYTYIRTKWTNEKSGPLNVSQSLMSTRLPLQSNIESNKRFTYRRRGLLIMCAGEANGTLVGLRNSFIGGKRFCISFNRPLFV